ncbi:HD domain-containing protein [bacterium]|nr:HD domain-containing protein [bacterium]
MLDKKIESGKSFFRRVLYRLWQFFVVMWPEVDPVLRGEVRDRLSAPWRVLFDRLLPSDLAHILRLYNRILRDPNLSEAEREELILLAITHDLGKGITRPTMFERVAKVLFPLPRRGHAFAGAKFLGKNGASPILVKRIKRHHDPPGDDRIMALFQAYDDAL